MKKAVFWGIVLVAFVVGVGVCSLRAEELRVSVAASMSDVFKELVAEYSKRHPDVKVFLNVGSSGGLAKQIKQGAPADLYISANPKWMKFLVEEGKVLPQMEKTFAYNSLVFLGMKKRQGLSVEKLPELERIAIGSPRSVPAGQYARQAMVNGGVYERLSSGGRLVMAKDVRQALIYADRGEVDGAFVYKTDAMLARQAVILFEVPQGLHDRVTCPVALTVEGSGKRSARELMAYLTSESVRTIVEKFGFEFAGQ